MSNVTIRTKPLKDNRLRIYLDFYPAIVHPDSQKPTRREFLKLFLYEKPKGEIERKHNKEIKYIAEQVRADRALKIAKGNYDFLASNKGNENFLNWLKEKVAHRKKINVNAPTWRSMYLHLYRFSEGSLLVKQVNKVFCERFRDYFLHEATALNSKRRLKQNSGSSYFDVFKEAIYQAKDEGLLKTNPVETIKSIPQEETEREFLTWEELKAAVKVDCPDPILKQAAIFSALTGLRFSFIQSLQWEQVRYSEELGFFLRKEVEKSNSKEVIFITEQARQFLGEEKPQGGIVFEGLSYGNKTTKDLNEWLKKAGIDRHITFHAFRHSFATAQLIFGTDIYTLSKLLHHKNVKTTQVYARVLDKKKKEAVNRLPEL